MERCRDAEINRMDRYGILLLLWAACAGDTMHRATPPCTDGECWVYMVHRETPPHGWWVLVVIVARGIPLEE